MRASDFAFFDAPFAAFAHRGGALLPTNLGRANTVHAFRQAFDLGYRYFETDVHVTKDKVLVAVHDDAVMPWTEPVAKRIADFTYEEWQGTPLNEHGDTIPAMEELLKQFPSVRFNIDAKSGTAVELLGSIIKDSDALDRVCLSSFSVGTVRHLHRVFGEQVPIAASWAGVLPYVLVPPMAVRLQMPFPVLQIPARHFVRDRSIPIATRRLIDAAHQAGKHVHAWTSSNDPSQVAGTDRDLETPEEMGRLLDAGIDGIFTDDLILLNDVLSARKPS